MKYATIFIVITMLMVGMIWWGNPAEPGRSAAGSLLYGISPDGVIYKINAMTCESCPILNSTGFSDGVFDLVVLTDGNILLQTGTGLRLYDPPNPNPIWSENVFYGGSILAPNGLVYLSSPGAMEGLSVFDPATNTTTFIGNWPSNFIVSEFFYQSGILYAQAVEGPPPFTLRIIKVDIINPSLSNVEVPNSPLNANGGTTNDGYTTAISTNGNGNILRQYNVSTNTFSTLCTLPTGMTGLTDLPTGVPEEPCLCLTFAGTVNPSFFNTCVPGSVTVPYNNNAVLDGNDVLRYVLYTDPTDILGSIVVQSSTSSITFNPATMQTGVTYYLATVAGNNQSGNVNLSDPCVDISNTAAQVTWRPRPAVTFSVINPNACAGDCLTMTANFTGTPPFNLTYTGPGGTLTQVFSGNTGTFQVCVPAGAVPGSVQVVATSLTDAWCGCQ
jgi:hypothetical protein